MADDKKEKEKSQKGSAKGSVKEFKEGVELEEGNAFAVAVVTKKKKFPFSA